MLVKAIDGDFKPLRLMLSRKFTAVELSNDKLRPVCMSAGALGANLQKSDLLVSRQHRMLATSVICERMFGQKDVLLSAIQLKKLPGIYVVDDIQEVEYFPLVFDLHEIVTADGAPSESFYTGPNAINALTDDAREIPGT